MSNFVSFLFWVLHIKKTQKNSEYIIQRTYNSTRVNWIRMPKLHNHTLLDTWKLSCGCTCRYFFSHFCRFQYAMQRLMKADGKKGLKILGTRRAAEISLLQLVCCVWDLRPPLPPPTHHPPSKLKWTWILLCKVHLTYVLHVGIWKHETRAPRWLLH